MEIDKMELSTSLRMKTFEQNIASFHGYSLSPLKMAAWVLRNYSRVDGDLILCYSYSCAYI